MRNHAECKRFRIIPRLTMILLTRLILPNCWTPQNSAGTLTGMTEARGDFGTHLDVLIRESGLSIRQVAGRAEVDEGTVRAYIRGYISRGGSKIPVPPTLSTVVKLADALEVPRAEMLQAAGIEAPARVLAQQPRAGELTTVKLLDMLRERIERHVATPPRFNPGHGRLTNEQVETRGSAIAALKKAAKQARDAGDDDAADAISDLVEEMIRHLDSMTAGEVSEDRTTRLGR